MNIRLKIICTLALIIPVMVVFVTLFQLTQNKNEEQRYWVDHTYQVINQVNDLLSDMQNTETGQRGYIITGDISFLEPYDVSLKKVDADFVQLRKLTQDNPAQQQRLTEFEPLMRNKLRYMTETIVIRKEQGLQAAVNMVAAKTGKALMDQMRTILEAMISEEQRLLTEWGKEYNQTLVTFYKIEAIFILAISITTLIMGLLLIRNIIRPLRALSIGAEQLGAGNYATRINISSKDEFNQLATVFNAMAEAIKARSQELTSIITTMADGLIIVDNQGHIRSLNPAAERMFDVAAEALVGKHVNQLLPQWHDDARIALATIGYRSESNGKRNDGALFPVALAISEMQINGNRLRTCLLRDISVQKSSQLTLTNALARAETADQIKSAILEHAGYAIILATTEGIITTFNPAAERMLGYSAAEMLGQIPAIFHDPQEIEARAQQFSIELGESITPGFEVFVAQARRNQPNTYEWTYVRKDGSRFPVQLSVTAVRDSAGEITSFIGMATDISAQKNIQMTLADNEARLRTIIETVAEGIITIDSHGIVETMNSAAEKTFAYPASEVIGRNINLLMPEPYHSQHDGYLLNYLTTGQAKIIGIGREVVGKRKDGSVFPMELAVSEMSINGMRMFTGLVRDITERKKIDTMKNEFISTVSHELRTPLTSIRGALELMLSGVMGNLPEDCIPLLEIANNNSSRLVRLINDILDIEKIESGKMEFCVKPMEIMAVVQQALAANQSYADKYGVKWVITSQIDNCYVLADSDRLIQVVTNLLSNAAKFSPKGESVEIGVARVKDSVRIGITDYGAGIPDDFRARIFSKFSQADGSSTKQQGGTGLGLSISKAIIEKLGGTIDYDSEINQKTCFYFDLPIYHQEANPVHSEPESEAEAILICEDDLDIANLLKLMLEKNGHSADIAFSAEQAKQMLFSKKYAAMTLDLMLPGQSGVDFFKELRQTAGGAELPVIVISAIADKGRIELNGNALSVYDWLNKPIDQQRLEQVISRVLEKKSHNHVRILHVEDDPDIVTLVNTLLKDQALVDVATNLEEAKIKLQQHYDLIILDMTLPDGSGSSLLSSIAHRDPPIPVVVFSAQENTEEFENSVSAFLVKSKATNNDLIQSIELILKHKAKPGKEPSDV